jgi:hypothetical protein
MANPFKVKHGLNVTGSIELTGDIIFADGTSMSSSTGGGGGGGGPVTGSTNFFVTNELVVSGSIRGDGASPAPVGLTGGLYLNDSSGPALLDEAASSTNPTLIPDRSYPATGFTLYSLNNPGVISNGSTSMYWGTAVNVSERTLYCSNASGPSMQNEAASSTNPTLIPVRSDPNTGIGSNGSDQLSLIAGGIEALRLVESGNDVVISAPDQHLILSSSAGGVIAVSGNLYVKSGLFDATNPSLAFGDGDTGLYETSDDWIAMSTGGITHSRWRSGRYESMINGGFVLLTAVPSSTSPNILPLGTDTDTGLGSNGADELSLIAGGVEALRLDSAGQLIASSQHLVLSSSAGSQVTVSGTVAAEDGALSAVAYGFQDQTNMGMYRVGVGNLGFSVNATKILDLTTTVATFNADLNNNSSKYYGWTTRGRIYSDNPAEINLTDNSDTSFISFSGSGVINSPVGDLILSSSATSQVTVSGTLQVLSGSGNVIVDGGDIIARGEIRNDTESGALIFSPVSQEIAASGALAVSGNLHVVGDLTVDGSSPGGGGEVTGSTNFFVTNELVVSGSVISPNHLILSSSAGSTVAISGALKSLSTSTFVGNSTFQGTIGNSGNHLVFQADGPGEQATVSGNLHVTGDLTVDGSSPGGGGSGTYDVEDGFLTSSVGSNITISGNLRLGDDRQIILDDDADTYIVSTADDFITFYAGGTNWLTVQSDGDFTGFFSGGPLMVNEAASATNPVWSFLNDEDTGVGSNGADQLSLIAGGIEILRLSASLVTLTGDLYTSNAGGPALMDEAASSTNPTLVPDRVYTNTGIGADVNYVYLIEGGVLRFAAGAQNYFYYNLYSSNASGPAVLNEVASSTNPTLCPDRGDLDTGVGQAGIDQLSMIAGGVNVVNFQESGLAPSASFSSNCRIIAPSMQQYCSLTYTANSNTQINPFVAFNTITYGGLVSANAQSGISYNVSNGRFTVSTGGIYKIDAILYLAHGSTTQPLNIFELRKNGSTIWEASPMAHSSVDPVERTISIIESMNDNQYLDVYLDSNSTVTLQIMSGSTFNIMKIA